MPLPLSAECYNPGPPLPVWGVLSAALSPRRPLHP